MPGYPQRDEEFLTTSVPGVTGMRNDIRLIPILGKRDMKEIIRDALRGNARLHVDDLSVDIPSDGRVVLAGEAAPCAKRDEAVATAWCAPGVTHVDDEILIEY